MDPNANLQEQERILESLIEPADRRTRAYQKRRLAELRDALADWIRCGGFQPDWTKAPRASVYYV